MHHLGQGKKGCGHIGFLLVVSMTVCWALVDHLFIHSFMGHVGEDSVPMVSSGLLDIKQAQMEPRIPRLREMTL